MNWDGLDVTYSRTRCVFAFPLAQALTRGSDLDLSLPIICETRRRSGEPGWTWEAWCPRRSSEGHADSLVAAQQRALRGAALLWVMLENEHSRQEAPRELAQFLPALLGPDPTDDYPLGGN